MQNDLPQQDLCSLPTHLILISNTICLHLHLLKDLDDARTFLVIAGSQSVDITVLDKDRNIVIGVDSLIIEIVGTPEGNMSLKGMILMHLCFPSSIFAKSTMVVDSSLVETSSCIRLLQGIEFPGSSDQQVWITSRSERDTCYVNHDGNN